jgi:hypothetical protein
VTVSNGSTVPIRSSLSYDRNQSQLRQHSLYRYRWAIWWGRILTALFSNLAIGHGNEKPLRWIYQGGARSLQDRFRSHLLCRQRGQWQQVRHYCSLNFGGALGKALIFIGVTMQRLSQPTPQLVMPARMDNCRVRLPSARMRKEQILRSREAVRLSAGANFP